jgi:hypothetical protein
MVYHDPKILSFRQLYQLFSFSRRGGKRLLHEHMLAVLQGGFRQLEMRPDRSDYRNCVDID